MRQGHTLVQVLRFAHVLHLRIYATILALCTQVVTLWYRAPDVLMGSRKSCAYGTQALCVFKFNLET